MVSHENEVTFSVSRNDLLFKVDQKFQDVFRFRLNDKEEFANRQGTVLEESIGFDFQNECAPSVEIQPMQELVESVTAQSSEKFSVYITIEDLALSVRSVVFEKQVSDLLQTTTVTLNLSRYLDLGFHRGFEIKCFVARNKSIEYGSDLIWSKSQIVYQTFFVAKASEGEALFEITWRTFTESSEKQGVLCYVDWTSSEVSSVPHTDCFEVVANNELKSQFKRLENNPKFGELCIRMIAEKIIRELTEMTLRYADIDSKPEEGSLHQKIQVLLEEGSMDFEQLAREFQNGDAMDQIRTVSTISKYLQGYTGIGQSLNKIQFGGFREK